MVTGSFTAYYLVGVHSGGLEGEEGTLWCVVDIEKSPQQVET